MRNQTAKRLRKEALKEFNKMDPLELKRIMPTYPINVKRFYRFKKRLHNA